jgi:hypothetical protein
MVISLFPIIFFLKMQHVHNRGLLYSTCCTAFADSIVIMNKIAVYFNLCYNGNDDLSEDCAVPRGKTGFATGLLDFHEF